MKEFKVQYASREYNVSQREEQKIKAKQRYEKLKNSPDPEVIRKAKVTQKEYYEKNKTNILERQLKYRQACKQALNQTIPKEPREVLVLN